MSTTSRHMQRELLQIQLRASAALNAQMAAALIGSGQDKLRKHFQTTAELLMSAHAELEGRDG